MNKEQFIEHWKPILEDGSNVNPSLSPEDLQSLGFIFRGMSFAGPEREGKVWHTEWEKPINEPWSKKDWLKIQWSCGINRYRISRDAEGIHNIPIFEGFLLSREDLIFILDRADLRPFYIYSAEASNILRGVTNPLMP